MLKIIAPAVVTPSLSQFICDKSDASVTNEAPQNNYSDAPFAIPLKIVSLKSSNISSS